MLNAHAHPDLSPPNLIQSFQGVWGLERKVINHLNTDLSGHVIGTAEFLQTKFATELSYREAGKNTLNNGSVLAVLQEYIYRFDSDAKIIMLYPWQDVIFEFNFHENKYMSSSASHLCSADLYSAKLELKSSEEFMLYITATGPNKDYSLESAFKKIKPNPEPLVTKLFETAV